MYVSISDYATWVSREKRQYLSSWEKSIWQLYLIFLLETIELLEYLDLFELKYYRTILFCGFLYGEEISFFSQNFVRGSKPCSQCWQTVGAHTLIKWKSSKEINSLLAHNRGSMLGTAWGPNHVRGSILTRTSTGQKMLVGTGTWQKNEHKVYANSVSEGSKLLESERGPDSWTCRLLRFQKKSVACKPVHDLDWCKIQLGFVFSWNYFWLQSY